MTRIGCSVPAIRVPRLTILVMIGLEQLTCSQSPLFSIYLLPVGRSIDVVMYALMVPLSMGNQRGFFVRWQGRVPRLDSPAEARAVNSKSIRTSDNHVT